MYTYIEKRTNLYSIPTTLTIQKRKEITESYVMFQSVSEVNQTYFQYEEPYKKLLHKKSDFLKRLNQWLLHDFI